jgi:ribonuclease E
MAKEMLINVSEGEECRIALLEDKKLEELYMERTSSTSHVGNIYKGRVTNVEPSIQAAFVDFGLGRNGFLHISDLMPTYFGRKGEDIQESVGRKMARRDRPPIQRCLRRGDEIIVQIIKEGIGTKGPTLSTYLSIPGRILVMMPGMGKFGVSRKIEDEDERRRLRTILDSPQAAEGRRLHHPHRRHRQDQDRHPARPDVSHAPVAEHRKEDEVRPRADGAVYRRRPGHAYGPRCLLQRHRSHRH